MKASTKRSTRTPKRSQTAAERIYARYVRDLRLLLVQSAQREDKLASMLQVVIDEKFFRPVITRERPEQGRVSPEMESDVVVFDSDDDEKLIGEQEEKAVEMRDQFNSLYREQFGEEPPTERHQEELIEA